MEKVKNWALYLHKHSAARYLFVGGSTFILDFGLLVTLHGLLGVRVLVAASVSYWTSILFNFLMNRHWTFSARANSNLHKHIILYSALLGINYLFTIAFIAVTTHLGLHYTLAKIFAVPIQMLWTYPCYKQIIFR